MRRRFNPVELFLGLATALLGLLLLLDHNDVIDMHLKGIIAMAIIAFGATVVITAIDHRRAPRVPGEAGGPRSTRGPRPLDNPPE